MTMVSLSNDNDKDNKGDDYSYCDDNDYDTNCENKSSSGVNNRKDDNEKNDDM
jgi:hypothetical protein